MAPSTGPKTKSGGTMPMTTHEMMGGVEHPSMGGGKMGSSGGKSGSSGIKTGKAGGRY